VSSIGAETQTKDLLSAARNLGLELHVINASSEGDFDAAFASGPPKVNPGDVTQVQPTIYHLERAG